MTTHTSAKKTSTLWTLAGLAAAMAATGCNTTPARTARTERPTQSTRAAAATSKPANHNPFVDPFAVSASGYNPKTEPVVTVNTQSRPAAQPSNPALNLYGEVMARSLGANAGGKAGSASGSNISQVSFSMEGADFDPNVSRDGARVVYASTQYRETADLFIKNVESRVVTQLTNDPANDVMPKLSPDGGRIAFASNRAGNWDIYVMPTAGGKAVQVTTDGSDDLHPTWSPDGAQLAFCRLGEVSGQWELWVTEVGNSGVARFIGYGMFPEWCPVAGTGAGGADRIAFQKSRERGDRAFGIWTVDYKNGQAGNTSEVASTQAAACINPAWSPDGQWIAYATVPNPSQWANAAQSRPASADLWMVDITGNSRVSLTSGKAVNLMPAWGPENRLFFVSDRAGVDNIWAMDTAKVVALAAANMNGAQGLASGGHTPAAAPDHPATEHTTPAIPSHATVPESGQQDPNH